MCDVNVKMDGKVVVVTDGSSGIGLETAKELARKGARIIIASRNETKLKNAREEIINNNGNSDVAYKVFDLASLESVRNFSNEMKTEDRLDVLINNAGSVGLPDTLTADHLNLFMQVHFFGVFLLTYLLIPKLKTSSLSRIVTGSSSLIHKGEIDFNHWNDNGRYSLVATLANSRLATNLFTAELNVRLNNTGVNVYTYDPYIVQDTDILENTVGLVDPESIIFINTVGQTKQEAGKQVAFVAAAHELDEVSGKHYLFCKETANHELVNNLRRRLIKVIKIVQSITCLMN